MKKYTNKEIIEEVNKLENIIDKKNYLKDLYLVDMYDEKFDKGSNKFVRTDEEMYFVKKEDLQEEEQMKKCILSKRKIYKKKLKKI